MADRIAVIGFILSMVGATYQMLSFALACLINNQTIYFFSLVSYYGFSGLSLSGLVVLWAASHLIESGNPRRPAWPSIILAIGVAGLGNLIIEYSIPLQTGPFAAQQTFPLAVFLVLLPSPLLLILGSILSFVAVRRRPRQ